MPAWQPRSSRCARWCCWRRICCTTALRAGWIWRPTPHLCRLIWHPLSIPDDAEVPAVPCQVEKAEKREEAVAVAVVQLLPPAGSSGGGSGGDPSGSHFLLVQRPPAGLLAGLWQFPLLQLGPEAADSPQRQQQLMDDYLEAQLGAALRPAGSKAGTAGGDPTAALTVVERRPLGQLVHVFSHIRMTMKVETIVLQVGRVSTRLRGLPCAQQGYQGGRSGCCRQRFPPSLAGDIGWALAAKGGRVRCIRRDHFVNMRLLCAELTVSLALLPVLSGFPSRPGTSSCAVPGCPFGRASWTRRRGQRTRRRAGRRCSGCPAARCRQRGSPVV